MTALATLTREAVPAAALPRLEDKVKAAGRKCARWGLPAPVLTASAPRLEPDPYWDGGIYANPADRPLIEVVDLSLTAPESIGIPGWRLLGRIDALPDGGHIIVRTPDASGLDLPDISDPQACDHCRSRRHRRDTFLVLEEASGDIRQVGRNCLADHLGYDPERLLWWSTFTREVDDIMGEHAPREERLRSTAWVLLTASRIVSRIGYMSSRRAEELMDERGGGRPLTTRQRVEQHGWDLDDAKHDRKAQQAVEAFDAEFPDDEPAHRILAATGAAINAMSAPQPVQSVPGYTDFRQPPPANEWQDNIRLICGQSAIRPRHMGIAVSAVILGLKAVEVEREPKDEVISQPLGSVGQRIKGLPVEVTFVRHFDGEYGTRTLIKARSEAQQADIIWWASRFIPDDIVGQTVLLTATVKSHEVDRFSRRMATTVTRAVINPDDAAQA